MLIFNFFFTLYSWLQKKREMKFDLMLTENLICHFMSICV
jgi:hypothetical protein